MKEIKVLKKNYLHFLNDASRVFNGDETCFHLRPKEGKVLGLKSSRNVYEIDQGNAKSNITVMFTFSASGLTTPPMIMYPYKKIPINIIRSVPDGSGIGHSENGWMKSELFF
ncbi:hypothetical protein NQ314_011535 [Rhamnusium bicolor]|uniref:DDE-1 domain-containing protein n=1 Tax=Rhamnusium bicolor TaxID=1586634 RepID=A0AAV8XH82_9CUCU|nr:hypothetical protein NQ314_011535 [Rhamnusium bicolor]